MADESDGIIYGLAKVEFGGKVIGWIDENGLQPAGSAPSFLPVKAAQVLSGAVKTIVTDPGETAFTFNLIQLKAQNLVDTIGGTAGVEDGSWTPPEVMVKEGLMNITTHSGHTLHMPKARVSNNGYQNGLNMQNVLALSLRVDPQFDEALKATHQWFAPGDSVPGVGG